MTKITNKIKMFDYLACIGPLLMFLFCATTVTAQDEDVKTEIEALIEKIRSITFEEMQQEPIEDIETLNNDNAAEPNSVETIIDPNEAAVKQSPGIDLDKIIQEQNNIENAFELAELLYANKHYISAQHCYQKALKQLNDDPEHNNDKAWIIIQIGNCLKQNEPDKAIETYRMIQDKYPLSFWAEYAKVQIELAKWYLKEKPKRLITK